MQTTSLQDGSEDVVTTTLSYDFKLVGYSWTTGWNLSWLNSDSELVPSSEPGLPPKGRYDLSRFDGGAFLAFHHYFVEHEIEVRCITYVQRPLSRNDYDATMGGVPIDAVIRLLTSGSSVTPAGALPPRPSTRGLRTPAAPAATSCR